MKVRATKALRHSGKLYSEGDVFSLDRDPALLLLQNGLVEPAIKLEPFRPSLEINGLTLWDACLLHVRDFPLLKPLLDETNLELKPYRLRVRQHARLPKWPGLPAVRPRRSASFKRRGLYGWQDLDDGVRVTVGAHDPWVKSGPSLEERYQKALRDYLKRTAIHFFLQRLADQELDAVGVGESGLMALKEIRIPAGWWRRDIELDLRRNEMCELMGSNPEQRVRRYSEVRIQKPTASQNRRPPPGRPSHREEFLEAFHKLWDNGSLTNDDLKNKKGVCTKVLEHLKYSPETFGSKYNTFVKHVGPDIDRLRKNRDSEN